MFWAFEGKSMALSPVCDVKRHHVRLDTTWVEKTVAACCKHTRSIRAAARHLYCPSKGKAEFGEEAYEEHRSKARAQLFNSKVTRLAGGREAGGWVFDQCCSTDGISTSLQFSRPKAAPARAATAAPAAAAAGASAGSSSSSRRGAGVSTAAGSSSGAEGSRATHAAPATAEAAASPQRVLFPLPCLAHAKRNDAAALAAAAAQGKPRQVQVWDRDPFAPTQVRLPNGPMVGVAGCDPGKKTLGCVRLTNAMGKVRKIDLTAADHKYRCFRKGAEQRRLRRIKANPGMERAMEALAQAGDGQLVDGTRRTASLRSPFSGDLVAYLRVYREHHDTWWDHMLVRREARERFHAHMRKHSSMDRFWARVKRELQWAFPEASCHVVAYGHAVQTLASRNLSGCEPTPSSSFHRSAQRQLGSSNVLTEDEYCTTKLYWDATELQPVYVHRDADPDASRHEQTKTPDAAVAALTTVVQGGQERQIRDRVRGLQYHPTRERCYVSRDGHAALNIALLACMRLGSNTRPGPFCRRGRVFYE